MVPKKIYTPAFNQQFLEDLKNSPLLKEKLDRAMASFAEDKAMQEFLKNRNLAS